MNYCTGEELRAFEARIVAAFAAGELPFLVHLSGGNEGPLIEIFKEAKEGDWFFSTHRNHYHYLLAGGDATRLETLIREGRSMFVYDRARNFISSAILAGTPCIACGVALALKEAGSAARVWCFVGDGAEDNGHFCEAVRYATGHDLPVCFVLEDNDRQVDTDYATRWGTAARFDWQSPKVRRYHYKPAFPHGGAGLPPGSVRFKPGVVSAFTPRG